MEWYGAFGLMIRLVWLYIEFLRLRSRLQSRWRRGLRTRKRRFGAFFFSGDARWATVGAHLAAMGIAGKATAPACAPTQRSSRARMFATLAAAPAPPTAPAASGCRAADAPRTGPSVQPTPTPTRTQRTQTSTTTDRHDTPPTR